MADIQNSINETNSEQTPKLEVRRIFGYRKVYVYVANLTSGSLYLPYLGYWGYRLPGLSDKTVPIKKFIRTHKTYRVRKAHYEQLLDDMDKGRIAVGFTPEEVAEAIQTALNPEDNSNDDNNT